MLFFVCLSVSFNNLTTKNNPLLLLLLLLLLKDADFISSRHH